MNSVDVPMLCLCLRHLVTFSFNRLKNAGQASTVWKILEGSFCVFWHGDLTFLVWSIKINLPRGIAISRFFGVHVQRISAATVCVVTFLTQLQI